MTPAGTLPPNTLLIRMAQRLREVALKWLLPYEQAHPEDMCWQGTACAWQRPWGAGVVSTQLSAEQHSNLSILVSGWSLAGEAAVVQHWWPLHLVGTNRIVLSQMGPAPARANLQSCTPPRLRRVVLPSTAWHHAISPGQVLPGT